MILALTLSPAFALDLSYEDALARASEHADGVHLARSEHAAALGALLVARAPFEPTLSLSGSWFSSTDEGQAQFGAYTSETTGFSARTALAQAFATGTGVSLEYTTDQSDSTFTLEEFDAEFGQPAWGNKLAIGLSQSLLQGYRLAWNLRGIHAAQSAVSAAELGTEMARQEAVATAARAYWALSAAERLRDIARLSRAASEEQDRITRALVDAGRLASVEGTRIAAALAQAERSLLEAEAAVDAAEDALAAATGLPLGTDFVLRTPAAPPPELPRDDEAVLASVLSGNLAVRLARSAVEDRERELRDARHALLPQLDANAGASLRGYDSSFSASMDELGDGRLPQWSVGAELTLPLLNRSDRGAVAQAEAAKVRAGLELVAREREAESAARAQLRTLAGAKQSLDLAELNVRLAEETLAAERARLGEGRSLQRDLITAQAELDRARADAERARTDWLLALVELDRLRGRL